MDIKKSNDKSFQKKFIDLYDDGQFKAECASARALVKEARQGNAYTKETIPDSFFVEVLNPGKCEFLLDSSFGILFWKEKGKRENGVFIVFNQIEEPVKYIDYKDLKDATFIKAEVCVEFYPSE